MYLPVRPTNWVPQRGRQVLGPQRAAGGLGHERLKCLAECRQRAPPDTAGGAGGWRVVREHLHAEIADRPAQGSELRRQVRVRFLGGVRRQTEVSHRAVECPAEAMEIDRPGVVGGEAQVAQLFLDRPHQGKLRSLVPGQQIEDRDARGRCHRRWRPRGGF